jgi:hypothetical protein
MGVVATPGMVGLQKPIAFAVPNADATGKVPPSGVINVFANAGVGGAGTGFIGKAVAIGEVGTGDVVIGNVASGDMIDGEAGEGDTPVDVRVDSAG